MRQHLIAMDLSFAKNGRVRSSLIVVIISGLPSTNQSVGDRLSNKCAVIDVIIRVQYDQGEHTVRTTETVEMT